MLQSRRIRLFFMAIAIATASHAQHIGISNNLLFDLAGAISAGVEIPYSKSNSLEVYGSFRPWKRGNETVHKHWIAQVQNRIYPCQIMNGFFWGPYVHGGQFNLGNHDLVFGLLKGLKNYRYEGWLIGGGLGVGYEYALAKHWNLGAELGVGYTYAKYKKYECEQCGVIRDNNDYNYIGVSRLGISIIYLF